MPVVSFTHVYLHKVATNERQKKTIMMNTTYSDLALNMFSYEPPEDLQNIVTSDLVTRAAG